MKKDFLKISITAVVICILLTSVAYCQDMSQQSQITSGFTFGITGGFTMPMGKFAKTDYADIPATPNAPVNYNTGSGFAGPGGNFGITGTYHINKRWGIEELFSYHQFSLAGAQAMALGMQSFPGGFDVDSVTFSFKGDNHTFNFLIGPVYTLELSKKFDVDLRLLVGFVNASLAGNNMTLTDGGVTDPTFYQAVSWANTFGGQLGAALRYNISNRVSISANIDYFYSKPDFVVNNINRNNNAGREIYSYDQPIEGVNGNLTLAYTLKHKK